MKNVFHSYDHCDDDDDDDDDDDYNYGFQNKKGNKGGAGVLVESHYEGKCPGIGCVKHKIERLEDVMFRYEFGPTTSPEEAFVKRVKLWFNEAKDKDVQDVIQIF